MFLTNSFLLFLFVALFLVEFDLAVSLLCLLVNVCCLRFVMDGFYNKLHIGGALTWCRYCVVSCCCFVDGLCCGLSVAFLFCYF